MAEITIVEIAKKCGVGVSTVSRALNNHSDINPETKKRILDMIKETGYIPNNSARNLKRTDAKCIAVLIKGITNPFFSPMIEIIEQQTEKKKYALVLRHVEAYEDEVDVALQLEKEKRLRGIVFLGGGFRHSADKLKQLNVPVIFATIGSPVSDEISRATYSTVAVDDQLESKRMTEYLLRLGHRRIAIITEGSEEPSVGQLRLQGYIDALQANNIPVDKELIRFVDKNLEHYSMRNGYETAMRLLDEKVPFTALFCISDRLALGACRAFTERGLHIPDDISVAGYDGLEMGRYYNPMLTTISQPLDMIARETIRLLFEIIAGESSHQHIIFPAELVEGESTKGREGKTE